MQGIVWLTSYPKSGNTWMRAFLANLLSDKSAPASFEDMQAICPGEAQKYWYQVFFGKDFPVDDDREIARVRGQAQRRIAGMFDVPVFLKAHSYLGESLGHNIFNMDITVGAIYIVRNPLDIAISAAPHFDATIDEAIDMLANEDMRSVAKDNLVYEKTADWSTHVKSWTQNAHPGLLVLRYEDMQERPEKTFAKVVRFINAKSTKKKIRQAITNSSFKTLQKLEDEKGFSEKPANTEKFFRKGKSGDWKDTLSEEQIKKIVDAHREQMQRFNYIPKGF